MKLGTQLYDMLLKEAQADKAKATLSLTLLNESAVGIGDHSTGDFHSNAKEALCDLCDANDRIETLNELLMQKQETVVSE